MKKLGRVIHVGTFNKNNNYNYMNIDIHTHILPKSWPDLKEKYGYGGWIQLHHHKNGCAKMLKDGEFFREINSNCWDHKQRIEECNAQNVDVQILSTVPIMFNYWAKPQDTYDLSKLLNDHIAEVISFQPNRFGGLGTLSMQDSKLAIIELERCIKELGLFGIQIGSNINDRNLNDEKLFPIFEAASELDASIFIHPWDMIGNDSMNQYWLPWLVGMPAETSRAICSLIFGGVFEKLPKLKIAFAHGGGSFPATIGRIQHGYKVRPDLCAVDNNIDPKNYLGKFWVDSLVHDPLALDFLISIIGEDKIMLGTDYPFPLGDLEPGKLIYESNFEFKTKEKILSKNAIEWLGINNEHFL